MLRPDHRLSWWRRLLVEARVPDYIPVRPAEARDRPGQTAAISAKGNGRVRWRYVERIGYRGGEWKPNWLSGFAPLCVDLPVDDDRAGQL